MGKTLKKLKNLLMSGRENLSRAEEKRLEREAQFETDLEKAASSYIRETDAEKLKREADTLYKNGDINGSNQRYDEVCKSYMKDKVPRLALDIVRIQWELAERTKNGFWSRFWTKKLVQLTTKVYGFEQTTDFVGKAVGDYASLIGYAAKTIEDPRNQGDAQLKVKYMAQMRRLNEQIKFYCDRWSEERKAGELEVKADE